MSVQLVGERLKDCEALLLDRMKRLREVEAQRDKAVEALRQAGSELEAGNDRKAKHIIQDALCDGDCAPGVEIDPACSLHGAVLAEQEKEPHAE